MKEEIISRLRNATSKNFGYDSEKSNNDNSVSLKKWKDWINSQM